MTTMEAVAEPDRKITRRPRISLWALRIVATMLAILLVLQPIFIGGYLQGSYGLLNAHSMIAAFAPMCAVLLLAVAISYVVAGGRWWVLVAAVGFVLGVEGQAAAGYAHGLQIHIPLGVAVVALGVAFCIWSWTPRAREMRRRRVRSKAEADAR